MIQKLTGWIKPQTLQGNLNVVPSAIGSASLQSKIVYPMHSEQVITPDDDFDGLSLVTVKPTPRLPAFAMSVCEGNGDIFYGDVVENVVDIAVGVESVTAEKYYTHFLYNGVRLPRIPADVLEKYPYAWIRNDGDNGNYNLVVSKTPWYYNGTNLTKGTGENIPYYSIPISSAETATGWGNSSYSSLEFGLASNRTVLWSNHDIPNGSADATDIYFEGTEPVPTD